MGFEDLDELRFRLGAGKARDSLAIAEENHMRDLAYAVDGRGMSILVDVQRAEVEAFLIKKALARHDGNARKAAEALGLSRSAFYRRLQQHGL